jgi:hypothetical protein
VYILVYPIHRFSIFDIDYVTTHMHGTAGRDVASNSNMKLKFLNSRGHFYFNLSSKENVGGIIAASYTTIINPSPHQISPHQIHTVFLNPTPRMNDKQAGPQAGRDNYYSGGRRYQLYWVHSSRLAKSATSVLNVMY